MRIKLTKQEEEALRKVLSQSTANSSIAIEAGYILLAGCLADDLRNQCSEYLQEVGFDEYLAPTETGRALESLIDKLFVG